MMSAVRQWLHSPDSPAQIGFFENHSRSLQTEASRRAIRTSDLAFRVFEAYNAAAYPRSVIIPVAIATWATRFTARIR